MGVQRRTTLLLGFHGSFVDGMESERERLSLLRVNLVIMIGLLIMSVAIAALSWLFVDQKAGGVVFAVLAGVIGFGMLLAAHALSLNLAAFPLHRDLGDLGRWIPNPLRLLLFVSLALILSQAMMLFLRDARVDELATGRMQVREDRLSHAEEVALRRRQQQLLGDRSILKEEMDFIAPSRVAATVDPVAFAQSPRKAILVGASTYQSARLTLPNVANDVNALKSKLEQMGYAVQVSLDEPRDIVVRKLQEYGAQLKPRDISIIFFSGHGVELDGHNYFLPVDFPDKAADASSVRNLLRKDGLLITPYIDDLTRAELRLHLLLMDACRTSLDGVPRGLAAMQAVASKNVVVAMAASPGQEALDGPRGGNSPYAKALLNNLSRNEDVTRLFRRVADEVKTGTAAEFKKMNKPPQTPWFSESVTDLEIRLLPPRLNGSASPRDADQLARLAPRCQRGNLPYGEAAETYVSCIANVASRINREIEYLEGKLGATSDAEMTASSSIQIVRSGRYLGERLSLMWEDYPVVAPGSFLLWLLMVGGLLVRDAGHMAPLRAYEAERYRRFRSILRYQHASFQDAIEAMMAPYRADERMPLFRHWSQELDFFAASRPRWRMGDAIETRFSAAQERRMWEWVKGPRVKGSDS